MSHAVTGTQPAAAQPMQRQILSIFGASVGNLIEWFDWYVYSSFALYFARSFFPSDNQTVQLLNTAAVFAIGFLARPVGSWVFGLYADRRGRKAALALTVVAMCTGSLMIALTPGYATIGVLAPVVLVAARVIQGLSAGGEAGTSATYLAEMAAPGRYGYYSSFQYSTLLLGQLLALGLLTVLQQFLLTTEQLTQWGWRIPFLIGAAGALLGLFIRRDMDETTAFLAQKKTGGRVGTSLGLLARYPREVTVVVGLTVGGTIAFYTFAVYSQKFLVNTAGLSNATATLVITGALFISMLLQPVFGALSDRVGRRPLLIGFGTLCTFGTIPVMHVLATVTNPWLAFVLIAAALASVSLYTSVSAAVRAELFPTEIRVLGSGFPYAIAVSVFGGTAEYIALWLKSIGHEDWFYGYVTLCGGLSLLTYVWMPETSRQSRLDDRSP